MFESSFDIIKIETYQEMEPADSIYIIARKSKEKIYLVKNLASIMPSHSRPYYQKQTKKEAPPNYPEKLHPDTYSDGPVRDSYIERQQAFIEHNVLNPPDLKAKAIYREVLRMIGGFQAHEGRIFKALNFISDRLDCSDFVVHSILRLVYQCDPNRKEKSSNGKIFTLQNPPSPELIEAVKETLLNFKYWPDEPGIDSMCTWTENHYILFSSAAYLSGQLYPAPYIY